MRGFDPKSTEVRDIFGFLLAGVAPRPIALVSTVSADGHVNLAPFSFFNAFSANPPIVAFSPSRRLRDSSVKDTYTNIMSTEECVIQVVTYDIVQQVNLASADFDPQVNEFEKSGLTPVESVVVKPPCVAESPFQMECRLNQMVTLGEGGASGNLAICEVVRFHIDESIIDSEVIDLNKLNLVARMGGARYCHASGAAVFEIAKPTGAEPIGYDRLPEYIRNSATLSAKHLALLAGAEAIPSAEEARNAVERTEPLSMASVNIYEQYIADRDHNILLQIARRLQTVESFETAAKQALEQTERDANATQELVTFAWNALVYAHNALTPA